MCHTSHWNSLHQRQTIPFTSVSESMRHDPAAIWAHMAPVLQYVLHEQPGTTNVYFLSDGPTTQYRQKKKIYLLSLLPFQLWFAYANWSFREAGHGKGATDGIGGTLKWTEDELVSHGTDMPDADVLYEMITPKFWWSCSVPRRMTSEKLTLSFPMAYRQCHTQCSYISLYLLRSTRSMSGPWAVSHAATAACVHVIYQQKTFSPAKVQEQVPRLTVLCFFCVMSQRMPDLHMKMARELFQVGLPTSTIL